MKAGAPALVVLLTLGAAPSAAQVCDDDVALQTDSDFDAVPDVVERWLGTDPFDDDSDDDGILDGVELDTLGTNPLNPDTDGDGWCDGGRDVGAVCRRGEDLNENGTIEGGLEDETDPVCIRDVEPSSSVQPTVEGTSLLSSCAATGGRADVSLVFLLAATLVIPRRARLRNSSRF